MALENYPLQVDGLDDREPTQIKETYSPNLRNVRTHRERVDRSPGAVLFAPTPLPGTNPGFGIRVGTFTKATATGNQIVTHSLGASPVALLLWTAGSTATNPTSTADNQAFSYGMSDGTALRSRSASIASQDGVGTSNTSRRYANAALTVVRWGETVREEAAFVSWTVSATKVRHIVALPRCTLSELMTLFLD